MAELTPLSAVRVGSTLLLPCKLTAKGAGGVTLEAQSATNTPTGTISINLAGAVSGAYTTDPRDQPAVITAFAMNVGDVVRNLSNGATAVVIAVNVGGDPNRWSPSAGLRPVYTTVGWEVIGTATIP